MAHTWEEFNAEQHNDETLRLKAVIGGGYEYVAEVGSATPDKAEITEAVGELLVQHPVMTNAHTGAVYLPDHSTYWWFNHLGEIDWAEG